MPEVTLAEEDTSSRSLTINAMAEGRTGPGNRPTAARPTSRTRLLLTFPAEDPLRVLRVARFATRYAGL